MAILGPMVGGGFCSGQYVFEECSVHQGIGWTIDFKPLLNASDETVELLKETVALVPVS